MLKSLPLLLFATPVAAQEVEREFVGTVTATIDAEERTFVVVEPDGEPSSGFERHDGIVDVRIVAQPDRSPVGSTPVLEIRFQVTGMGPTADATAARVSYTTPAGEMFATGDGAAEVSLTAFGIEEEEVTASGNFSSQLQGDADGMAELAIEGDFQASIRQPGFVTSP